MQLSFFSFFAMSCLPRAGVGNDTVLMGTVPSGGRFLTGAGGDTMVNLGTVNLGGITSNGEEDFQCSEICILKPAIFTPLY
jgi:hypothetical protein